MAKNKMSDLRNHLFATLEALNDDKAPMDPARARAISEVAQTIINSAKVEVDFMRAIDASKPGSEFFEEAEDSRRLPAPQGRPRMVMPPLKAQGAGGDGR